MNLPNGHLLQNGKYRLTQVVGQGGFGITYKGVWFTEVKGPLGTIKTEVSVCVKEYFFKDYCYRDTSSFVVKVHSETGRALFEKFKEKLIKEATILSEVHHPHIVNVLEVFEENGTAYIAMEYISGNSLKYRMDKEGVLPEAIVLRYVHQIGEALQFVHEKSILHLDIKPSNILIDQSGKARLIDFGVSKRYDIEQQETSTTMLTLSKGFASIEQYDNEGTISFSPCPDIYSLGATMYNLLTGKIPTESILRVTRPLQIPRVLNPAMTKKTEEAILKAMQIVPGDRFQTMTEMLDALDRPLVEEEENKNNITSPEYQDTADETTILYSSGQPYSNESDDDATVLNNTGKAISESVQVSKNKKRKATLISAVIILFASIGSAVALFVQRQKSESPVTELTEVRPEREAFSSEKSDIKVVEESRQTNDTTREITNPTQAKKQEKAEVKPIPTDQLVVPQMQSQPPAATPPELSEEEIHAKYAALIVSGKTKMAASDFLNAKQDFAEAKKIKLTEEVVLLGVECESKEKEKLIADQKALYEDKMLFGESCEYRIVRKKSNGKYGAIDNNAIERIPCKYKYVGVAGNGRNFVREDGLSDIYNAEGKKISEGVLY